jgi:hypothetical protein
VNKLAPDAKTKQTSHVTLESNPTLSFSQPGYGLHASGLHDVAITPKRNGTATQCLKRVVTSLASRLPDAHHVCSWVRNVNNTYNKVTDPDGASREKADIALWMWS